MRRILLLALVAATAFDIAAPAMAQGRQGQRQQQEKEDAEAAARRKRDRQFEDFQAPLPGLAAAGPCPYVKVLYDAARYVEFKGAQASSNVAYSGEIEGIAASCAYKGDEPIKIDMTVSFSLGKGPQGDANQKDYTYWVAVTDRNKEVLAKEYFTIRAPFQPGKATLMMTDHLAGLEIPRANANVAGSNFEVLVGFDVTPEMAQFNRDGKRFRIDAGQATAAAGTASAQ